MCDVIGKGSPQSFWLMRSFEISGIHGSHSYKMAAESLTHPQSGYRGVNKSGKPFQQYAINPFSLGLTILVFIFKQADKLQNETGKPLKLFFAF